MTWTANLGPLKYRASRCKHRELGYFVRMTIPQPEPAPQPEIPDPDAEAEAQEEETEEKAEDAATEAF